MLYIFLHTISKSKHKCYCEWFVWCLSSYIVMARTMFWLWYRGGGLSLGLRCLTPLSTIFQLYRGWTRFSCITSRRIFLSFIVSLFVCLFICLVFFVCFVLHRSYFCFVYYIDLTSVLCITSILLLFFVSHGSTSSMHHWQSWCKIPIWISHVEVKCSSITCVCPWI